MQIIKNGCNDTYIQLPTYFIEDLTYIYIISKIYKLK